MRAGGGGPGTPPSSRLGHGGPVSPATGSRSTDPRRAAARRSGVLPRSLGEHVERHGERLLVLARQRPPAVPEDDGRLGDVAEAVDQRVEVRLEVLARTKDLPRPRRGRSPCPGASTRRRSRTPNPRAPRRDVSPAPAGGCATGTRPPGGGPPGSWQVRSSGRLPFVATDRQPRVRQGRRQRSEPGQNASAWARRLTSAPRFSRRASIGRPGSESSSVNSQASASRSS